MKGHKDSQTAAILRDLRAGLRITPLHAIQRYGCLRLAARISDLRRAGHPVRSELYRQPNGRKAFSVYWLEPAKRGSE